MQRKSSHYDHPPQRIFIGIAGGSAAGKTTLCETINRHMAFDQNFKVQTISLDSFYISIDKTVVDVAEYNFDHPLALDFNLAYQVLQLLKTTHEPVAVPQYSFVTHQRLPEPAYVNPANIILFEGLMAFHDERIRNMMTYRIFINCDDDIRLCRRIQRDINERGRDIVGVLKQYNKFVKNAFRDFVSPTSAYADLIIPGSRNNRISVDFIVQHIKNMARKMNIFQKAMKTKIYLFGENELFDRNVTKNYSILAEPTKPSFLIFPTSVEHQREIEFVMNSLMSQAFTEDYFEQVYIFTFMKIVRSLLRQLISLFLWDTHKIQLISSAEIREKFQKDEKLEKPIKIIFVPIILNYERFDNLDFLKTLIKPGHTIVIVNLFCEMRYPNKIYNCGIQGLKFINLLLVANKKRWMKVLTSNNMNSVESEEDWLLYNENLMAKGLKFLSQELKIPYEPINSKDVLALYEKNISEQPKKELEYMEKYSCPIRAPKILQIPNLGSITQISTLPQRHPNLCGFHAVHNVLQCPSLSASSEIPPESPFLSQQKFIENYMNITKFLRRQSPKLEPLFEPLERSSLQVLLTRSCFFNQPVLTLFISQNFIISSEKQLNTLTKSIQMFKNGLHKQLYIIVGVYNHYIVVKVEQKQNVAENEEKCLLYYLDSMNTPIETILNHVQQPQQFEESNKTDEKFYNKKLSNLKTAIEVIMKLCYTDAKIEVLLVQLRIDEIIGSYYRFKERGIKNGDEKVELAKWVEDEYPVPVLKSSLLNEIRKVRGVSIGDNYVEIVKKWLNEDFVRTVIDAKQAEEILKELK